MRIRTSSSFLPLHNLFSTSQFPSSTLRFCAFYTLLESLAFIISLFSPFLSEAHHQRNLLDWAKLGANGKLVIEYTEPTASTHGLLTMREYGATGNRALDLATLAVSSGLL